MKLSLPYLDGMIEADLEFGTLLGTLDVADSPAIADVDGALRAKLANPIGQAGGILDRVQADDTITIIVSDSFRETKVDQLLPTLLEGLRQRGVPDEDVRFLFSTGVHRGPTEAEQERILGSAVYARVRTRLHVHDARDPNQHEYIGTTSRGTPVEVNRLARSCERLIVTGSIVMHYFGGFGGGRKSLLPGICSARTIAHNHALNLDPHEDRLDPRVRIGVMEDNPVAEDMLEGARMISADCVINTVLNRRGEIAEIFAGGMEDAHRAGCAFARRLFAVPIEEQADLVIAASGRTRNFVQTHKALYNAYQAVKPGGRLILAAPCPEGLGGESFEKWLRLGSRDAIIQGLRRESEINGQTALSTLEKAATCTMVTQMPERDVKLLGAQAATNLPNALDISRKALNDQGVANPTVYVMPSAAYTVPIAAGFDR